MNKPKKNITVLGAGISGLTIAYWLKKAGHKVTILEACIEPGGTMQSQRRGKLLIDYGPNSGLETTPLIGELVTDLNLQDEIIYANDKAKKRYILKKDQLFPLPTSTSAFLKTKLFSTRAKLNLLLEPFKSKSKDGYNQSISRFVVRRLGKEFLDYAVNPFVSGIFAGNPDRLSVKSALPRLYRLEEEYGSLIKGMIKGAKERKKNPEKSKQTARMFSFRDGMQTLPIALANAMSNELELQCEVEKITKTDGSYEISYLHKKKKNQAKADAIVSTLPAYVAKDVFKDFGKQLYNHFNRIYYPPVAVLYLVFDQKEVKRALDGFGFLIPAMEQKKFLGAIWSSTLFPQRADDKQATFTLYIGGTRNAQIFSMKEEVMVNQVLIEFKKIMKIDADPLHWYIKKWSRAIPQYNLGYHEHELYFDQFENENPGLFLAGNYRGGVSVGDCIKNSKEVADKVLNYL
jgi:protoporphyrinogen/coproporphyrinogen III oxidase